MAAVLVHIDLNGGHPDPSSLIALAAGRHVASSWGATLYAAVVVHDPAHPHAVDPTMPTTIIPTTMAELPGIRGLDEVEATLARHGTDKVVIAVSRAPVAPLWSTVGHAWQGVLDHLRPRLVLFGADAPSAAELGPRTAARIGARLLPRARATGIDDVELRDRDGGYARASDGGAAVALVGRAAVPALLADDCDVDLLVLAMPGAPDDRVELVTTTLAEVTHAGGTVIVLGDDVAGNARAGTNAHRLAELMNAHLVGGAAAADVVGPGAVVERTTPLAPALCITVGAAQIDLAGATSVIKLGATGSNRVGGVDGALPGPADKALADLVARLERA